MIFVTFPYIVLGQVWYLIDSIPDLCLSVNNILLTSIQLQVYNSMINRENINRI